MNSLLSNILWSHLIIEELSRHGLNFYINSPGYRSASIIEAISCSSNAQVKICYDERSAGFFALGYAKATSNIPVLLCTSGSAVANYFPAVVEAFYSKTPLFIITADKTEFLQDLGSNQVIKQRNIFSSFTCFSKSLPTPFYADHYGFLLQTIDQCVENAYLNQSPIHLNIMFDKPLISKPISIFTGKEKGVPQDWWNSKKTYRQVHYNQDLKGKSINISEETPLVTEFKRLLLNSEKVLFVIGEIKDNQEQKYLINWIKNLPFIIYVDVLSEISKLSNTSLGFWNYFAQSIDNIDLVIYIGEKVSMEQFSAWIDRTNPSALIHCTLHDQEVDVAHRVIHRIVTESYSFLDFCSSLTLSAKQNTWVSNVLKLQKEYMNQYLKLMESKIFFHSFYIVDTLFSYIPEDCSIFIANSSLIRVVNSLPKIDLQKWNLFFNRGVSGIDGNIATAFGIAQGSEKPTWALIGDLACLHDLSSFTISQEVIKPLTLCVLNDSSGGIFSYLPVSEEKTYYKKFFQTPHNYYFKGIAEMFGWDYYRVDSAESLKTLLDSLSVTKHTLIEIIVLNKHNSECLKPWITL